MFCFTQEISTNTYCEKKRKYHDFDVQIELERKTKFQRESEDKELERIVVMFNTKNVVNLNSGNLYTLHDDFVHWKSYGIYKFQFNIGIINNIKNKDVNELIVKYKKLCEDMAWIRKYVYGFNNSKPFVDYVYDNFDFTSNRINEINLQLKLLDKEHNNRNHPWISYPSGWCDICLNINKLNNELSQLNEFNHSLNKITKSREYYYVNYEEFLDLFGPKNQYGDRAFEIGDDYFCNPINLDSLSYRQNYGYTGSEGYFKNSYYYHLFHIFDREKYMKLNFLEDICKYIGIIQPVGTCLSSCGQAIYNSDKNIRYDGTGDLITDHINFIKINMNYERTKEYRTKLVNFTDFDDLYKLGEIIVELIEFVKA